MYRLTEKEDTERQERIQDNSVQTYKRGYKVIDRICGNNRYCRIIGKGIGEKERVN